MAASNQAGGKKEEGEGEKWRECLGREDSREFDNSLFFEYEFSIDQLMEITGLCVAQAVARCYQGSGAERPRVLVVCGPGNNGGDGLAAARHLLFYGYDPVIFYPKRTRKEIYQILVAQCEKLGIPLLPSLPSAAEISASYLVVIDAIFGFSFKGDVRAPFDQVISTLRQVTTPIASVDIPSGWDVEKGDVTGQGLTPDLLISLTAPKICSQHFQGSHHYLGLRIIPTELAEKFRLKLPQYPGTDNIVRLK